MQTLSFADMLGLIEDRAAALRTTPLARAGLDRPGARLP